MVDMNDSGYRELKPLDAMKTLELMMIWMILCHELKPQDAINNSRLWTTLTTFASELRALDAIYGCGSDEWL